MVLIVVQGCSQGIGVVALGNRVTEVAAGSAASLCGLREGDLILAVDGVPLGRRSLKEAVVRASVHCLDVVRSGGGDAGHVPRETLEPLFGQAVSLGLTSPDAVKMMWHYIDSGAYPSAYYKTLLTECIAAKRPVQRDAGAFGASGDVASVLAARVYALECEVEELRAEAQAARAEAAALRMGRPPPVDNSEIVSGSSTGWDLPAARREAVTTSSTYAMLDPAVLPALVPVDSGGKSSTRRRFRKRS